MSLRKIFEELYKDATARETPERPGEADAALKQGATVKVRVRGRERQVILGRPRVYVSEQEIRTFRTHGDIPPDAERRDWPPTAKGWCYVELRWEAPATLWEMPRAELPASLGNVSPARPAQQDAAGEGEELT